jgi:hypothetical protein
VTAKAQEGFNRAGLRPGEVTVHPRLGIAIFDHSSWAEDEVLREMWAGLLVSSATPGGTDESNLMFTDLLSRLTSGQARLIDKVASNGEVGRTVAGLIVPMGAAFIPLKGLQAITGVADVQRLDREMDHLRALALLSDESGFQLDDRAPERQPQVAVVTPTSFALQMYARCHGSLDPVEYFRLTDKPPVTAVKARFPGHYIIQPPQ